MYLEASVFRDLGELGADGGVKEGDATSNFAAEWVVKSVVTATIVAVE